MKSLPHLGSVIALADSALAQDEQNSNPTFEARRLQSAPGWYVRVAWRHSNSDHIPGFVTQREAVRWIEEKAPAWLSEKSTGVLNFIARPRGRDFDRPRHADQRIESRP